MRKYVGWEGRRRRRRDVRRSVANEFDCMPNGRRCQSASEAAAWETTLRRNEITPLRFLPRRLRVCPIFWKEPSFPSSSLPPFPYSQPCLVPHERPNHIYSLRLAVHVLARVYTWVTLIPRNFRRTNGCRGLRQFVHWDEKQVPTLLSSRGCSRLYPFDAFLRSCFSSSLHLDFYARRGRHISQRWFAGRFVGFLRPITILRYREFIETAKSYCASAGKWPRYTVRSDQVLRWT